MTEFEKYAMRHMGISSLSLHRYMSCTEARKIP